MEMKNENCIFSFEDLAAKIKNNNKKFYCIGGILIGVIIALSIALAVTNLRGGTNIVCNIITPSKPQVQRCSDCSEERCKGTLRLKQIALKNQNTCHQMHS